MSRKFRPLESKTPCDNCKNVIYYNSGGTVKGVCKFANWKGRTKTACKDYKEIEDKYSRLNTAINNFKKAIYNSFPDWLKGKK